MISFIHVVIEPKNPDIRLQIELRNSQVDSVTMRMSSRQVGLRTGPKAGAHEYL